MDDKDEYFHNSNHRIRAGSYIRKDCRYQLIDKTLRSNKDDRHMFLNHHNILHCALFYRNTIFCLDQGV